MTSGRGKLSLKGVLSFLRKYDWYGPNLFQYFGCDFMELHKGGKLDNLAMLSGNEKRAALQKICAS